MDNSIAGRTKDAAEWITLVSDTVEQLTADPQKNDLDLHSEDVACYENLDACVEKNQMNNETSEVLLDASSGTKKVTLHHEMSDKSTCVSKTLNNKRENVPLVYCELCKNPFSDAIQKRSTIEEETFQCEICDKFIPKSNFSYHMFKHAGKIMCELPKKAVRSKSELFSPNHTKEMALHYKISHKSATDTKSNVNKIQNTRSSQCEICKRTFSNKAHLSAHMRVHTIGKSIVCESCSKSHRKSSYLKTKVLKKGVCSQSELRILNRSENTLHEHVPDELATNTSENLNKTQNDSVSFDCKICKKTFVDEPMFFRHMNNHKGKCELVIHKRRSTGARSKSLKCEKNLSDNLPSHSGQTTGNNVSTNIFTCGICKKSFLKEKFLRNHMFIHSKNKLTCDICSKTFKVFSQLIKHIHQHKDKDKRIRTNGERYLCKMCSKSFLCQASLDNHEKKHTVERQFICDICGESFATKSKFSEHKDYHVGKFTCEICSKTFKTRRRVREHRRRLHTDRKRYPCSMCSESFLSQVSLDNHERKHTGEKPFICDICGESFAIKSRFFAHKAFHLGKFICEICCKVFGRKPDLITHKRLHTGEKLFVCEFCGKQFATKGNLFVHLHVHSVEKFTCEICNKSYASKNTLLSHMYIHTGEFTCAVCSKSFQYKALLVRHMRVHTGEKPYTCEICNESFTWKTTLVKHMRTHNEDKADTSKGRLVIHKIQKMSAQD